MYAKLKNWTLFSVASVLNHSYKNSIVFRLARHLCSSTSLVLHKIETFSLKGVWKKAKEKCDKTHIIGGLLSTRLQQAVLLNSIKVKYEGLGGCG